MGIWELSKGKSMGIARFLRKRGKGSACVHRGETPDYLSPFFIAMLEYKFSKMNDEDYQFD